MEALKKDIEEIQNLMKTATRANVKLFLGSKIQELETKLKDLKDTDIVKSTSKEGCDQFLKQIKNYSWDQSDDFVKIYISLDGLSNLVEDNIRINYNEKSVDLHINNLNGCNYQLLLPTLLKPINTKESSFKVKNNVLYVFLKKEEKSTWGCLNAHEKKPEPKYEPPKPSDDPTKGLMDMVKKMYDEGDDETKRMLNKAMSEAYSKKGQMPEL